MKRLTFSGFTIIFNKYIYYIFIKNSSNRSEKLNITFFITPSHIEKKRRREERGERYAYVYARHTYEERV